MFSSEPQSRFNPRPHYLPKPPVIEETLANGEIDVERKSFKFRLKENAQGRFLRITEVVGGKHNNIIIPDSGLEDFARTLAEMIKASGELPPK